MTQRVKKAVFPVAGMGTRFLPATKSVPKEIMTLVDRPLIQYSIDEARAAGIEEFIFVTAKGKTALEDYFDRNAPLEDALRLAGKTSLYEELLKTNMESGALAYIRQNEAKGLGHAVWCARNLIGNEPFAVLLPDDVMAGKVPCLKQMVDAYEDVGGNMVATMEVPQNKVSSYGILDVAEEKGRLVKAKGMVEKPNPHNAPSRQAVVGRYILSPDVMTHLNEGKRGAGGEIQLTDAIAKEIELGRAVNGFCFEGQRYDCGSKSGFLQATVAFGLGREELADDLKAYLRTLNLQ